jgi:uncharacterized membrane protein (DUF4010 family)
MRSCNLHEKPKGKLYAQVEEYFTMVALAHSFPPLDVAAKIGVSLGIGLLAGLEREWAHKDLGVRTFGISALLGMVSSLASLPFALISMVGVLVVIAYVNWRTMLAERALEATTSIALLVTFVLGVLVGQGHLFTPIASAVVLTALLAWKAELRKFAGGLKLEEIRSAVLLGLLAFVIYPILPDRFVDPWKLVNPREAWVIVVVIASIGFVNYVLLKFYGARGLYYSGFLGGLVNSTAAAAELAGPLGEGNTSPDAATAALLLTVVAMFARNLLILALFSPSAVLSAAVPLVAMTICALIVVQRARTRAGDSTAEIHLQSPVSIGHVLSFAVLFLMIQIISELGQRHFGRLGFLGISVLGGLISSASTSAAAAKMVAHGQIDPNIAGTAVVLTSFASALINLPIIYRRAKNPRLFRRVTVFTVSLVLIGIVALALAHLHRALNFF